MSTENSTNRGKVPVKPHNIPQKRTNVPKKPLTAEQIDARNKRMAEQERLRRERRETFFARLSLCLIIYVVFCMLTALFVYSLYTGGSSDSGYKMVIADNEGKAIKKISAEGSNIDGTQYISASNLSLLYDFTLAGDKQQVTLYFHNISQSISLYKDSAAVEINGSMVRLGAKIIFTDDYYIPVELIETYFYGAIIKREKGTTTLSRRGEDDGFTLRVHAPETPIPA